MVTAPPVNTSRENVSPALVDQARHQVQEGLRFNHLGALPSSSYHSRQAGEICDVSSMDMAGLNRAI
jgi:hypothetical protein